MTRISLLNSLYQSRIKQLLFCCLFISSFYSVSSPAEYVGSTVCASCHDKEFTLWKKSHHFQAMQPANSTTVLGDFNNATFSYAGIQHRFFKKADKYFVETDNKAGELQQFAIIYVFGFTPLQQYLIAFPDGRYQALSISWDARPKSQGGQRWYHLYPDEAITHKDPLHWTGHFQNWNSRCASCHSTNLQKNYTQSSNTFATSYSEVNVACEACHGEGDQHVDWAKKPAGTDKKILSLKDSGKWQRNKGEDIARRVGLTRPQQQTETCAACHSLRAELDDKPSTGKPFHDNYQLRMLDALHYFADGQINEEVYVYGSFLQSKMYQAGVVCADCHDPHSGKVKSEDNALCLQCHNTETYEQSSHHKHRLGLAGSYCVNCHMPEKTYMGVDPRRDHSFPIPNPVASEKYGVPNACSNCHQNDSKQELSDKFIRLFGASISNEYPRIISEARKRNPAILNELIAYIQDENNAVIKRASALQELVNFPSEPAFKTSMLMLQSKSALLRRSALISLAYVPVPKRNGYVSLLNDPDKSVRMELAPFLAPMPTERLPDVIKNLFAQLLQEYIATQKLHADMPSTQLNLANLYLSLGAAQEAEQTLQQALVIAPLFVPALLNMADLYRGYGQEDKAEQLIRQAVTAAPDSSVAYHALGLLQVRLKQYEQALESFRQAVSLDPDNPRHRYIYAVALQNNNKIELAIEQLQKGLSVQPHDTEMLNFIIDLLSSEGRTMEAELYKARLP
jgi:predicted CXXCH cytochrome family protein